jgi:[ribosomal protein S18]-alanine N-acetyltransferase
MTKHYQIRPFEERDIPQAIDIDKQAFPTQWPHPTYSSYKNELKNRLAHYIVISKLNDISQNNFKEEIHVKNNSLSGRLLWLKGLLFPYRRVSRDLPPPARECIIGIAGIWVMVDEAHITTIGVRNDYLRQGFGELLLISIINLALQLNADVLTLEVRISNTPAQALYKKYGFKEVGIRRRYYSDNSEDAIIMTTEPIMSHGFGVQFQQLCDKHQHKWKDIY